ncbi:MAG: THUMP domain-containing protein [Cyanobacteria bacterium J06641_5]
MTEYFATVAPGLEPIAAGELEQLGATDVRAERSGVRFCGDRATLYRANLWGRTIFRILQPLREFPCANADQLYQQIHGIEWEKYFSPAHTLAVRCTGSNAQLNHTHYSALQVKNAIVDRQLEVYGERSSVSPKQPDMAIDLHIFRQRGTVSLDSSGGSLHRRGYRPAVGLAPLKETLASALIAMTEWEPGMAFCDPLCGSGTLVLEAGLRAANIAPGSYRSEFGFERWPDFDARLWQELCQESRDARTSDASAPILGSDREPEILAQAKDNARSCGLGDRVEFLCRDLSEVEAPADTGVLICNPPYGKRIGDAQELGALYKQIGDTMKQRFKGWTAYVFTGNKELGKRIGLRCSRRIPVSNGSLPCTLMRYELY